MAKSVFEEIVDYRNRADPYPLYAELRKTPVARQEDGTYVVSTYREIVSLLHDPRVSNDARNLPPAGDGTEAAEAASSPPDFLGQDPPGHDRLRRLAMRHFGPPHSPRRVDAMTPELVEIVTSLIDNFAGATQVDIVDDFAYPFPVTVICRLLGVPREDEPRFHEWVDEAIASVDPSLDPAEQQREQATVMAAVGQYFAQLAEAHRREPGDDMLSGLVTDDGPDGRMSQEDLISTAMLLLTAGHETTVNLITNGTLTLLRHPDALERLRREPDWVVRVVEELLRYEPPVHFVPWRNALDDIEIAGTTIPKGAPITLVLAAGSRDPDHTRHPDRFDPDRERNEHLGFGGGIHLCFGGPLARLETQIALTQLVRRLENPRLVTDPPPYRPSPVLRGPRHLHVEFDRLHPAEPAATLATGGVAEGPGTTPRR